MLWQLLGGQEPFAADISEVAEFLGEHPPKDPTGEYSMRLRLKEKVPNDEIWRLSHLRDDTGIVTRQLRH